MEIKGNTYYFTAAEKKKIKKLVDRKYGKISTAIDYETTSGDLDYGLEADIYKFTHETISGSTLERLVGLTGKKLTGTRAITVDITAKYLGFQNSAQFCKQVEYAVTHPEYSRESLDIERVFKQHLINLKFGNNKRVIMRYLNASRFEIIETSNSKLLKGDIIELNNLEVDEELNCQSVSRIINNNLLHLGGYHSGENNKINDISFSK